MLVGLGFAGGLFIEQLLNADKSSKALAAVIRENLPNGAALWGYDLNENTEGCLIFYGLRPRRLTTVEEAAALARAPEPAIILLSSRGPELEFRDQISAGGSWRLARQARVGGRYYWLMDNPAARGEGSECRE